MDIASKKVQDKYAKLCQELGDLSLKQEQISNRVVAIKSEIDSLNITYSILADANKEAEQLQAQKLEAVENEKKKSK